MEKSLTPLALYIHVPFCKAKCTYCDFYSIVGREQEIPRFIAAIKQEIHQASKSLDLSKYFIDTIFFGGGTPNLLAPRELEQILTSLFTLTNQGDNMEIGMEINPGEASLPDLIDYRTVGINRISIGMQSFQPDLLKFMSRIHSVEKSFETFAEVRKAGFSNVSGDLIFALPGQTKEIWEADLKRLVAMEPEHISTYSLTVEEGTALSRWVQAGHVETMEETIDTGMYAWGREFLEAAGYPNYEISNHAKPGYACRHNLNYWTGVQYLGFGPAAHSYFQSRRHWNVRNLDRFLTDIEAGQRAEEDSEIISETSARNEAILTELRLARGLDLNRFQRKFGEDLLAQNSELLRKWGGGLTVEGKYLKLTSSAWALVDEITSDLMQT